MLRPLLLLGALARPAAADPGQLASDTWPVHSGGTLAVEAAFVTGFPPALSTGLSRGVGAAASVGRGPLRAGVRAAWVTATESSTTWRVTHTDVQLRLLGGVEHVAGRGKVGLRVGLGGSLIHETRVHAQGARAGLEGDALEMSALSLLPAADLEAVVGVAVYGAWGLAMSGGPSVVILDGEPRASWIAQLGIAWRP